MNQRTTTDDGLFRLAGSDASWIWVHTCPIPRCPCRSALVLATHEGRETLETRGAPVRQAWMAKEGHYREIARTCCDDLVVFDLDIDTAQVLQPNANEPLDLEQHPEVAAIAARIDGELLDAIGRLWYRGKGLPDPVEEALSASVEIVGWHRGEQLAWHQVCDDVRQDRYVLDGHVYDAWDFHCPIASCDCAEVNLHFEPVLPGEISSPGHVNVHLSGNIRGEPEMIRDQARLEQLWTAFCQRHPRYLERLSHRDTLIKMIGKRLVPSTKTEPKVGRNDPCPCGSGKKYKKCCGS